MAEARSEEEAENLRRGNREQVVRRPANSSGGRPDRRKPEQRHSQGPLSSIRAVIKRTSRSTSVSETHRDRDRDRDRRRPEITILAAEPLPSTSWFPGAAAGIPPPPPPAQIWGTTIAPDIQPPPSYEEVIREKTQEQDLLPPADSSSSSPSVCRTTIATQTDPGTPAAPQEARERKPAKPPRPPPPCTSSSSNVDDANIPSSQSRVSSAETNSAAASSDAESATRAAANAQSSDSLSEHLPSTSTSGAQTDASPHVLLERPRPRPRTRLGRRPINEVKVQTLVKLREDGLATLAARAASDGAKAEGSNGKYLQELLEAFSSDNWGFPDHYGDNGERSQSESEDSAEENDDEDMATLRARIQAFEEQQQVADASGADTAEVHAGNAESFVVAKRPEPRPRPRLQGQPAKSAAPVIAPKPKNVSLSPKPSSKVFWEDRDVPVGTGSGETTGIELNSAAPPSVEPLASCCSKSDPGSELRPVRTAKPQTVTEPLPSSTPVPASRPPPPKLASSPPNPRPSRRPTVAPRSSLGALPQGGGGATESTEAQTVKGGSIRSTVKPAASTSPRRGSAPSLAPKPTAVPPPRPDPKPAAVSPAAASKPPGPPKPPTPATRKGSIPWPKAEASDPTNPASADSSLPHRPPTVKLLPLRPPPIKSAPGRPPPPSVTSTPSTNQSAASKPAPAVSVTTNQTQKMTKKGPPLPPRPKPGHPLYSGYVKQEVLIVLDDQSSPPAGSQQSNEGTRRSSNSLLISPSPPLLDSDSQPELLRDPDGESKTAIGALNQSDVQSILSVQPAELKEEPDAPAISGPRCLALFDYEGEDDDELTFSQGDVIALLELVGEEWGRGQIHGRTGIFPLNFAEVVEALPGDESPSGENPDLETDEWAVALFDFPGQTEEDLSFLKGALIRVMEHVDAEWRRGCLDGREGLFPAAFTQTCQAQPITGQQAVAKAVFEFTAEKEDELTLKVGEVLTQVEAVDEQWIVGVVGGKRGIVPKNYISFL